MSEKVLNQEDSIKVVFHKMSNGNPGALNVLNRIINKKGQQGFKIIFSMDSMGLYGSDIWVCYKDYCNESISQFIKEIKDPDSDMMDFVE